MPASYELHFQEGFAGETVVVLVDDAVVARFEARTRMQIGLAHIEKVPLSPGQVVTIRVGRSAATSLTVEPARTFIEINYRGDALSIEAMPSSPGYL